MMFRNTQLGRGVQLASSYVLVTKSAPGAEAQLNTISSDPLPVKTYSGELVIRE